MDEQRLQEIEARAELATKGVWLHTFDQDNHELGNVWGPDGDAIAERVHGNLALGGDGIDNAAFIAHAREDVPALIAEVRRLRQDRFHWMRHIADIADQRDAALAERDAVREQHSADLQRDHTAIVHWQTALTEARRVLRSCEWAGRDRNGHECCPVCGMVDTMGHDDDCALAAVLAQEEK